MIDVAVLYKRYKFIGHEFLTWLWFIIEQDPERINSLLKTAVLLEIGNRIVLEKTADNRTENIRIKGDDAGLEEGRIALKKGGVVTELNLRLKIGELEWRFSIKGESLCLAGVQTPTTGVIEKKEDMEGAVLEKIYLYENAFSVVDALFKAFIESRVSDNWDRKILPAVQKWIHS